MTKTFITIVKFFGLRTKLCRLFGMLGLILPSLAQTIELDTSQAAQQAVERLVEYIQIDTVNPPGNEFRAVEYFAKIFDAEKINYQVIDAAPGRSNIIARLKGGNKPGLILLNHTDVVPFDENEWSHPPLSGTIDDGIIYGRGALDMKNVGIIQLQAFLWLHQNNISLNRDVLFVATADEEAGGNLGAGYLVKNHPQLFKDMGYLLTEGGGGRQEQPPVFSVSVTEKVPFWIRVTAKGEPGHGSVPLVDGAVSKLVSAINNLQAAEKEVRVTPVVREYLKKIANTQNEYFRTKFLDIDSAIEDSDFIERIESDRPRILANLSNTCSVTRLEASSKINVIPNSAWAELDCRLLPDQDKEAFKNWLLEQMDTPDLVISEILSFAAASSSMDSEIYQVINNFLSEKYPGSTLLPTMTTGFTDAHWFREIGINSYGFIPSLSIEGKNGGFHGNDERVSVENIKTSTSNMIELLRRMVVN